MKKEISIRDYLQRQKSKANEPYDDSPISEPQTTTDIEKSHDCDDQSFNDEVRYSMPDISLQEYNPPTFKLFKPDDDFNQPCDVACFCFDNGWDRESVKYLREKTESLFIIGLKTSDIYFLLDNELDSVIECQNNEIELIVNSFNKILSKPSMIGIDFNDIRVAFSIREFFNYKESDNIILSLGKENFQHKISRFIKKLPIENSGSIFVFIRSNEAVSLENLAIIFEKIENKADDDWNIFYAFVLTQEPDSFYLSIIYATEPPAISS